jgi:cephalosporin-C deacetylase
MHFDLPLHELRTYRPPQTRQPDFEPFWRETLTTAAQQPLDLRLEPLTLPYHGAYLARARYAGWQGAEIVGTWAAPEGDGPFPAVAMYHGYSSTRPDAFVLLSWVSQGYAVLAIDVRGQSGESSDSSHYPGGQAPGYLTRGIEHPASHYYRGAYIDAVRAVEALASHPTIDSERIGVVGASQGGALTLAAAALCALAGSVEVRAAVAEIPFLCHFERAATLTDSGPYTEIGAYCRRTGADSAQVFRTLSYFDVMNLTSLIRAPTLVTSGLMDMICPPSTIFAAYNNISVPKEIFVDPFGEHDTFPGVFAARARWLNTHMA